MKKFWFSSDYHFDHKNILKYDKRPFKSIEEMNNTIIKNHNSVVSNDDDFYFLGDFCFNDKHTEMFLRALNGNKFFIRGNHDKSNTIKLYKKYGIYLGDMFMGEIGGREYTLCHYAMRVWNKSHHASFHLYGHSHGSLKEDINSYSTDIGCMNNNYYPFEDIQIETMFTNRIIKPIDHHGNK